MSWASTLLDSEMQMFDFFDAYVVRGGYDALCQILELEIAEKGVYRFFDVPEDVWYEFRRSDSLIGYVRKHLAGHYEVQKRLDNKAV